MPARFILRLTNALVIIIMWIKIITGVAQPCRYCFYSLARKWVFRPTGATRCPNKRESWHGGADRRSAPPCQLSRSSGQKCGNIGPKTVKILNLGQKFVHQGRLVCNIFTKFSEFVAFKCLVWSLSRDKHPSYKHIPAVGAFSIAPSSETTARIKKVRVVQTWDGPPLSPCQVWWGSLVARRL